MFSKIKSQMPSICKIWFQSHTKMYFADKKFSPFQKSNTTNSPFLNKKTVSKPLYNQPAGSSPLSDAKQAKHQTHTPFSEKKQAVAQQKQIKSTFIAPELDFGPLDVKKLSKEEQVENDKNGVEGVKSANDAVMSSIGLNRYLTKIYYTTGWSLFLTLSSASLAMLIPGINETAQMVVLVSSLISFASFSKAQKIQPKFIQQKLQNGQVIHKTINSPVRLAIYGIGCVSMGIAAAPMFIAINEISAIILPLSMAITVAMFGGASLIGLMMPKGAMLGYGNVLLGGMVGLIALNLGGIILGKYTGYTVFAETLMTMESYIGIGLFNLMLMYDTHLAIARYEKGDADHLGMSIQILLDLWNLIIRIAKEIAKNKLKNQNKDNKS